MEGKTATNSMAKFKPGDIVNWTNQVSRVGWIKEYGDGPFMVLEIDEQGPRHAGRMTLLRISEGKQVIGTGSTDNFFGMWAFDKDEFLTKVQEAKHGSKSDIRKSE